MKIEQRFDTTANWQLANPVLSIGELAVEYLSNGARKVKVGDGTTAWTSLDYVDDTKQDLLVSGESLKTINGASLLGSGDIVIEVPVTSVNGHTGIVVISIADISGLQESLDSKAAAAHTHTTSDITDLLDGEGKLYTSFMPSIAVTDTYVVANEAAMLALDVQRGDIAVRSDLKETYILAGDDPTDIGEWVRLESPTDAVLSVNGYTGVVSLGISDLSGLQEALDGKASSVHSHVISQVTGLQTALDDKADDVHTHAISDVTGLSDALGDKQDVLVSGTNVKTINNQSIVGSGNIDITSGVSSVNGETGDVTIGIANISGLQLAIDGKSDTGHTHTTSDITDLLDGEGKFLTQYLPAIAITDTFVVATESAMLALDAQKGDVAVRTDLKESYILADNDASVLANWVRLESPTDSVLSVNGQTGIVVIGMGDISGLQEAIDGKQATLVSGTNIKSINGTSLLGSGDLTIDVPVTSVNGHTGDVEIGISDISGLETAIDAKQDVLVSGTNIKTVNNQSILGSGNINFTTGARTTGSIANTNDTLSLNVVDANVKFRLTKVAVGSAKLEVAAYESTHIVDMMRTDLHSEVGLENWVGGDGLELTTSTYVEVDDNIYTDTNADVRVLWVDSSNNEWELKVTIAGDGARSLLSARKLSETGVVTTQVITSGTVTQSEVNESTIVNSEVINSVSQGGKDKVVTISNASGVVNLDLSAGNIFRITRTGNITGFTISNFVEPYAQTAVLVLDGASYSVAWGSVIQFPTDETPTLSTSGKDQIVVNFVSATEGLASRILKYS